MNNVYDDPSYAEVRERLHQLLRELRIQYKDTDDVTQKMLEEDIDRLKE